MTDNTTDMVVFKYNGVEITEAQKRTFVGFISRQEPTEEELMLHFHFCAAKGVHPLDRTIYFTKRSGQYVPITSIDYMRMRAESSESYAGSDDAVFKGETRYADKKVPASATVTVWKFVKGQRCPFTATAIFSEYVNSTNPLWKTKPHVMLSKCAEALALRKAFPGQVQGLYVSEEFDHADALATDFPVNASHNGHEPDAVETESEVVDAEVSDKADDASVIEWFDGTKRPAEELVDEKTAEYFVKKFVGTDKIIKANAHLKNHLRRYFHVDDLSEMTWDKMRALILHVKGVGDDARWYRAEEQASPALTNDAPVGDSGKVDLNALTAKWTKNEKSTFSELDASAQERVTSMLDLVTAGAIEATDYDAMIEVLAATGD
jgi:phage recombination protein Bet